MRKIAICDSNEEYRKKTENILFHMMFDVEDVQFRFYDSGGALRKDVAEGRFAQDLLVMDFRLQDDNGLRLLDFIRKCGLNTDIIIQTEMIELAVYGYRYHVFDFIKKPVSLKEAEQVFRRYIAEKVLGGVASLFLLFPYRDVNSGSVWKPCVFSRAMEEK